MDLIYLVVYDQVGSIMDRMRCSEALRLYPDHYCSEFLGGHDQRGSTVWRYVQVGPRRFWLEIAHPSEWNAESRGAGIKLNAISYGYHSVLTAPLFAIDILPDKHLYAFNYTTSPMLADTPIEDEVSAAEVVRLLGQAPPSPSGHGGSGPYSLLRPV